MIAKVRAKRDEDKQQRRLEIMDAAERLFRERPDGLASMDELAEAAGLAKGTLYLYFRSKEEIYTEIRATAIRGAISRLEAIIARGGPPSETLDAAIRDLVGHIFDELDRFANVLRADSRLSAESRTLIRGLQREYERLMRGIIERGVREGAFAPRDPSVMTFTLLRACLGVADWYHPGGRLPPEAIVEQVTEQVMNGVLRHAG